MKRMTSVERVRKGRCILCPRRTRKGVCRNCRAAWCAGVK